jgi:Pyruvate/2-oxoacid:ferredoxin oxidoreductase gamma subunit
VLARAATLEGRQVTYLGLYGGMMRGGNTDSTVVVADAPIEAPPVVAQAWSAIAMHDEYWEPVERRLRPGGLVLCNDATFTRTVRADVHLVRVPATEIATREGNPLAAAMVIAGAYIATTDLVRLDSTIEAMRASIPPYRTQHIATNERAIRAGFEHVERSTHPAWAAAVSTESTR